MHRSALALLGLLAAAPLAAQPDFGATVQPLLEQHCLSCHSGETPIGKIRLDSRAAMIEAGALVPGRPEASALFTSLAPDAEPIMPPTGALPAAERETVRAWIAGGAEWPEGSTLDGSTSSDPPADLSLVERLRERIIERSGQATASAEMAAYEETVPGAAVSFEMIPIPAGEFVMGSPEDEPGRRPDEGPRRRVKIDAFWMMKTEVVWDLYRLFMFSEMSGEAAAGDELVDAVSRPTRPYVEMSFGMGVNGYPAISMTQYAAQKFTEWLSATTGRFYRLPTEAEWEYACRAGTTTAYSFGDDPAALGDYAWYWDNSGAKYGKAGEKKPNPWGLHDMHGNVMEWTLDAYSEKRYPPGDVSNPWVKPTALYPRAVRGGSWNDDPDRLRCAARVGSSAEWKMQDPQLPKSIWYHTDAQWLGLRVVRPARVPSAGEMFEYWNSGRGRE